MALNPNYSSSQGIVATDVQQYMDRKFLPRVTNDRVYGRDFQTRALPLHNGKRVQFNKMNPFAVSLEPLKEGVVPDGQTVYTSALTATIKPYGQYVTLTDETDWGQIDTFKSEIAERLGDQARDTIDAIDCAALKSGLNVMYGGSNTSRSTISSSDKLTYQLVQKAVRTLEKNKAKRFGDGFYHAIVGPETKYDLMNDQYFVDISKYQNSGNMERNEIGKMFGVKFFETNTPMLFKKETYLYDSVASLALSGIDWTNKKLTMAATTVSSSSNAQDIAHFIRRMAGKMITISDGASSNEKTLPAVIDHVEREGTNLLLFLRWYNGTTFTYASGAKIVPMGAGASDADVHGTIIYGRDFAGGVSLGSDGKNVSMIIKPVGSSGKEDPLNQISTIGWKIKGYTATILQDAFIVRIEHGVSA